MSIFKIKIKIYSISSSKIISINEFLQVSSNKKVLVSSIYLQNFFLTNYYVTQQSTYYMN